MDRVHDRPRSSRRCSAGGVYPGMITATIGTALLLAVVATSVVIVRRRLRYEWWYAVHLACVRRHRALVVPRDPDRERARPRPRRGRLLARRSTSRRSPSSSSSGLRRPSRKLPHRLRVAEVSRRAPASSRCASSGAGSTASAPSLDSSSCGGSSTGAASGRAHPFSLSARRRPVAADHREGARRPHRAPRRRRPGNARVSPRGRSGLHRVRAAAAREGAPDRRRHRDHADPRRWSSGCAATSSSSIACCATTTSSSRTSWTRSRAARASRALRGRRPRAARARGCSRPSICGSSCPTLAERDVFLCGPPAMTDAIAQNLRAAGVPRRRLHAERFALT